LLVALIFEFKFLHDVVGVVVAVGSVHVGDVCEVGECVFDVVVGVLLLGIEYVCILLETRSLLENGLRTRRVGLIEFCYHRIAFRRTVVCHRICVVGGTIVWL